MVPKLLVSLVLPALAWSSVWPAGFAGWRKVSSAPAEITDRPLWDEYGLAEAETARYEAGGRTIEATAWKMGDSTGAFAAFQWQQPAGARSLEIGQAAAGTASETLVVEGSYLLRFQGFRPKPGELRALAATLPGMRHTTLPVVAGFLPPTGRIAGSERYLLGPVGLEKFFPGIPAAEAGFDFSGEAEAGRFRTRAGEAGMAVFYYPTPAIARQQFARFEKIPGVYARRSGPLVAAVVSAAGPDQARELLDRVQYEANITWNERTPIRRDNVGELLLNAFILTGIVLAVCVGGGLAVGGMRLFAARGGQQELTVLRIREG